jgi:hypothetical protein
MSQVATQTTTSEAPATTGALEAAQAESGVVTPAPEAKPVAEAKPAETVSDSGKKADAPVAFELKLPEGSLLDKSQVEGIVSFAKEKGLALEVAQAILERESSAVAQHAKAQTDAWNTQAEQWVKQVEADKEIGGDNFKENISLANRVFQKFGSKELGVELDRTSLGNHPELLRLAVRIGKAMGEDKFVSAPKGKGTQVKSAAEQLYPNHYKEN